jgi:hypothetical protein
VRDNSLKYTRACGKRRCIMSKPLSFYRTSSALRITPDINRGVFWVDGANTLPEAPKGIPEKGIQKFNWEEKLLIALSPDEGLALAECAETILRTREGKVNFFHDPKKGKLKTEAEPKTLTLSVEETDKGDPSTSSGHPARVFLNLSQGSKKVAVVLGRADLFAISILIPYAVCAMWDWAGTLSQEEASERQEEPGYYDGDETPF